MHSEKEDPRLVKDDCIAGDINICITSFSGRRLFSLTTFCCLCMDSGFFWDRDKQRLFSFWELGWEYATDCRILHHCCIIL